MKILLPFQLEDLARTALLEDLGQGDVTADFLESMGCFSKSPGLYRICPRKPCVVSGLEMVHVILGVLSPELQFHPKVQSGDWVESMGTLGEITGPHHLVLKAERTVLNFLQHLCGVATETAAFVQAIDGTGAFVTDTRKTTPGLRLLEKRAVVDGGGRPHRDNLSSAVMLKDNHLQELKQQGLSLSQVIETLRREISHTTKIEVEVESLAGVEEALLAQVDIIMLDNMSVEAVRQAVELIQLQAIIEVSGGISLDTIRGYAEAGAQYISTSKITLGASPIDIGLDV
ncbi:MAG: carboxylating nicotinate-nucleotide diphosphorylase [Cyanobacteria bacterium]|nr:carboxylating nicotinate-nucleotide diphosphorylase [Cyanobacteriota bacterium]